MLGKNTKLFSQYLEKLFHDDPLTFISANIEVFLAVPLYPQLNEFLEKYHQQNYEKEPQSTSVQMKTGKSEEVNLEEVLLLLAESAGKKAQGIKMVEEARETTKIRKKQQQIIKQKQIAYQNWYELSHRKQKLIAHLIYHDSQYLQIPSLLVQERKI